MAEDTSKQQHPQTTGSSKEHLAKPHDSEKAEEKPRSQKAVFQTLKPQIETAQVEPLPRSQPTIHTTTHTTLDDDFDVDTQLLTPEEERALNDHKEHNEPKGGVHTAAQQKSHAVSEAPKQEDPPLSLAASQKVSRFTRRQIFGWVISVFILVLMLWGVLWGLFFVWHFFQDFSSDTTTVTDQTLEPEVEPETSSVVPSSTTLSGWIHSSVYSGLLIGTVSYSFDGTTGLKTTIFLGTKTETITTSLEEGLALVKKISSALKTDVRALLDNAFSRTKALDDYVSLLQDYEKRVLQLQENLRAETATLNTSFTAYAEKQASAEESFFDAFAVYDGASAQDAFAVFTAAQEKAGTDKAYYKAFNLLDDLYTLALDTLAVRLKDITLNRAALLEGVQVVNIAGSDLDLILSEDELSQ